MKNLLVILFFFIAYSSLGQSPGNDTSLYIRSQNQYGIWHQRTKSDKVTDIPLDTIYSKDGVARIGSKFFVGNGIFWRELGTSTIVNPFPGVDSIVPNATGFCWWIENFARCANLFEKDTVIYTYPLRVKRKEVTGALWDSVDIAGGLEGYQLTGHGSTNPVTWEPPRGATPAVDSIWRTPGQDSIKFSIDGRLRSIKDSAGGSGGGTTETASNGLTKTVNDIKLGGTLTGATTIDLDGNELVFSDPSGAYYSFGATQGYLSAPNGNFMGLNLATGNEVEMIHNNGGNVSVRPDRIEISNTTTALPIFLGVNNSNGVLNPVRIAAETMGTTPTNMLVLDGDTVKSYPFSGGGGGAGTVTNVATGLGLSGGPITTTGTILVDTADASILSRQRAAATYATLTGSWLLSGNSVTAGSDFLGSTNNVSLRFRTNNTEIAVLDSNGRFGLGTTAPTIQFHQVGTTGPFARFERSTNGTGANFVDLYNTETTDGNSALISFTGNTTGAGASGNQFARIGAVYNTHDHATRAGSLVFLTANAAASTVKMTLSAPGYLGIGVAAPATPLDVNGSITFGTSVNTNTRPLMYNVDNAANQTGLRVRPATGTNVAGSFSVEPKGTGYSSTYKSAFGLFGTDYVSDPTNFEALILSAAGSTGYVMGSYKGGTGTIRPIILDAGVNVTDHTSPTAAKQLYLGTNGNIGIGTATPATGLHINRAGNNMTGTAYFNFINTQDETNYKGTILGYDASGQIGLVGAAGGPSLSSQLAFWTINSGTWSEKMRITNAGNVGIGDASPASMLTVGSGDLFQVNSSGNIVAATGLTLTTAGNKINIATGTNASIGVSGAMTAGAITISTTAVTASSKIFLTHATVGGTQGFLSVGTIVAGTSFVINSSSGTDTGTVNWWIIN